MIRAEHGGKVGVVGVREGSRGLGAALASCEVFRAEPAGLGNDGRVARDDRAGVGQILLAGLLAGRYEGAGGFLWAFRGYRNGRLGGLGGWLRLSLNCDAQPIRRGLCRLRDERGGCDFVQSFAQSVTLRNERRHVFRCVFGTFVSAVDLYRNARAVWVSNRIVKPFKTIHDCWDVSFIDLHG